MSRKSLLLGAAAALVAVPALAGLIEFKDSSGNTWGSTILGFVNGSNQAQRVDSSHALPVSDSAAASSLATIATNFGGPRSIVPTALSGQATMAVSTTSTAVSSENVTLAPNSTFPSGALPSGVLSVKLQATATGNISVCWRGGTCTASTGVILAPGESVTKTLPAFSTLPPSIISVSGSQPVELEW